MPATGVSWETDDNGFIISARGKTTATYRYDSDGISAEKTTAAKEGVDLPLPPRRRKS